MAKLIELQRCLSSLVCCVLMENKIGIWSIYGPRLHSDYSDLEI
jgi:hypothetical protein